MAQPEIYFIRHGQTDWNAEYRFQGQRDIPINATGRQQAARNGEKLRELLAEPTRYDFIASPLARTRETMSIIRQELGLPVNTYATDDRLKEIHYGDWEGHTAVELNSNYPELMSERENNKFEFVTPNGESYSMLLARVLSWLTYIENNSIVACHGGIIRVLMHHLAGMDAEEAVQFIVPQDRIFHWNGETANWV